jgi:integrase
MPVRPHIGHVKIQKLRAGRISEMYAALLREGRHSKKPGRAPGLSARTVSHVHRVLHKALDVAVRWDVVEYNVADKVDPPRVEDGEIEIIKAADLPVLLNRLRGRMLYTVAIVGLGTGIRRGEMLALRRQDIDLAAGSMRIERSLEQTKAGLRFKPPKTKRGKRTITLPTNVVAELRARFKQQQEQWLALGLGKVPDDALVFATWDGSPRSPNALSTEWAETMVDLGLRYTLHSLRHAHASALIAGGMDVETLSRRLGHAKASITLNVYSHLFSNTDDRAAEIMEAAFSHVRTD